MLVNFTFAIQSIFYLFSLLSFFLFSLCFYLDQSNSLLFLIISIFNCLVAFLIKIFDSKINSEGTRFIKYLFLIWPAIILLSSMPFLTEVEGY